MLIYKKYRTPYEFQLESEFANQSCIAMVEVENTGTEEEPNYVETGFNLVETVWLEGQVDPAWDVYEVTPTNAKVMLAGMESYYSLSQKP